MYENSSVCPEEAIERERERDGQTVSMTSIWSGNTSRYLKLISIEIQKNLFGYDFVVVKYLISSARAKCVQDKRNSDFRQPVEVNEEEDDDLSVRLLLDGMADSACVRDASH